MERKRELLIFNKELLESAKLGADWFLNNQIKNKVPGEYGRYIFSYDLRQKKIACYSMSFASGAIIMALLNLFRSTGKKKYLHSAELGAEYLKFLQMDSSDSSRNGAILDFNPKTQKRESLDTLKYGRRTQEEIQGIKIFAQIGEDSPFILPRDGATAGMAFIALYRETGVKEYLSRAKRFGEWYLANAIDDSGWPYESINFDTGVKKRMMWAYEGGSILFLYQMFKITRDDRYRRAMLPIAEQYIDCLQNSDGSLAICYPVDVSQIGLSGKLDISPKPPYIDRHQFNDDFSFLGILCAYLVTKDKKFLESAKRYGNWLVKNQSWDGGYSTPQYYMAEFDDMFYNLYPDASATAIILLADLYRLTKEPQYIASARTAAKFLMDSQIREPGDKITNGSIIDLGPTIFSRLPAGIRHSEFIGARVTSYAITAFLKLEGKSKTPYYSIFGWGEKV